MLVYTYPKGLWIKLWLCAFMSIVYLGLCEICIILLNAIIHLFDRRLFVGYDRFCFK